nr:secreted protein [Achlya hypogyna]
MKLFAIALLAAAAFQRTAAHGHLVEPLPEFVDPNSDPNRFCATLHGPTILPGDTYNKSPGDNAASFTKHFKASKFKTLKDLITSQNSGGECGITKLNPAKPQSLPSTVRWRHGDSEGFTSSHEGPCELWCDNTRVYQNDNCAKNIPDGSMPIEVAKCAGAKQLTFYWLALHTPEWQVYKNCVALGGSGPAPTTSPTDDPTDTPTNDPTDTPTEYPTADPTEVPTDEPTDQPSTSPSPSTYKPSPSTHKPNPSTHKPNPSTHKPNPSTHKPSPRPPTKRPTMRPTPRPSGNKIALYGQCGGKHYSGPTECVAGSQCDQLNDYYFQCRPKSEKEGRVTAYGQCGGKFHTGPTMCGEGYSCVHRHEYYSQCMPEE